MIATVALAVALIAVLVARHFENAAWSRERSELLTRIQAPREAPALIAAAPHGPARKPVDPAEPDNAEFALVGAIVHGTGETE